MNKIIYSVIFAFVLGSCSTNQVSNTASTTAMNTSQEIDRSVMPKPGPAPKVNIGKPESFTLDNGLKVMVVENHKLPRVSMSLNLDNPPVAEGDRKGVRTLLSSMLGNGTSTMSKDDFNEEIDFYGASVNFNAGGAYASTLSKYFPQVANLVAQGVLDPLLTEEEFENEKSKLIEGLKADEKNVTTVASNLQDALLYGLDHPFGEFVTENTVKNVTFEDVKAYYKNYFVPGDAYLVVVGDIKFEEAKELLSTKFDKWEKGSVAKTDYPEPQNLTTAQINFVDMPNAVQSEVATLNVTNLKMTDPDYYAAMMANQILGGGGEGRLFLNLREANGWTYGSYSRIKGDKEVNRFMTTASVRNAVTDSAIVEMINELGRIRTELVTDEELANAKAKYIGNFVMQVEKPEVVARQALKKETQDLPDDYYENYIKNINAVTKEDVRKAAQKYFGQDNARIVVVGKSDDVLPALQGMNIPIKYYDRFGKEVDAPRQKEVSGDVTAMGVVTNYLNAIGGADKAKSIKSYKANFEMTGAAPQPISGTIVQVAPNREKMVMTMNGMTVMQQVFDGTTLKVSGMMGNSEQSGDEVAEQASKLGIIAQAFYMPSDIELKGIADVNGKDAYKVKVTKGDKSYEEFYDVASGLLVQKISTQTTPQGEMSLTESYNNYQTVDGIKFPFVINQSAGPQNVVMTFSDIKINENIADSEFE